MTETRSRNPLGAFSSLLGLFSILLYFTGWIYRWSYYSFFNLDVNTLDFAFESFLFVPIQVVFGGPFTSLTILIIFLISFGTLNLTIKLFFSRNDRNHSQTSSGNNQKRNPSKVFGWLNQFFVSYLPKELIRDLAIILWILFTVFWIARYQGWKDAQRDARVSSSLPFITIVFNEKSFPIGRNPASLSTKTSSENTFLIGDNNWYEYLKRIEVNDKRIESKKLSKVEDVRAWRLLLNTGEHLYAFVALSDSASKNERPIIISIPTSSAKVQILSPDSYPV